MLHNLVYLAFPCKRAHRRIALTSASVVFPLRLHWVGIHQVYIFLNTRYIVFFSWPLNLLKSLDDILHKEMKWNYSPQGNSSSLKNKLKGRSFVKWSSRNYSYSWLCVAVTVLGLTCWKSLWITWQVRVTRIEENYPGPFSFVCWNSVTHWEETTEMGTFYRVMH